MVLSTSLAGCDGLKLAASLVGLTDGVVALAGVDATSVVLKVIDLVASAGSCFGLNTDASLEVSTEDLVEVLFVLETVLADEALLLKVIVLVGTGTLVDRETGELTV